MHGRPRQSLLRISNLKESLERLQAEMLRLESENVTDSIRPVHQPGARNLLHYVALRRHDIRELQERLAGLGLSSLGRTESHVMAAIRAVLRVLTHIGPADRAVLTGRDTAGVQKGRRLLDDNTAALLGPEPPHRRVRIMVTMPTEAATQPDLASRLVASGMNCMRINCAHDGPKHWEQMIRNLRRAHKRGDPACKVEMDLAGPKLRTGPVEPGPAVRKIRPKRDAFGRVLTPARVWLTPEESPEQEPEGADARLPFPRRWLTKLQPGASIHFTDTRGSRRKLEVLGGAGKSWWAEAHRTAYVAPGLKMTASAGARSGKGLDAALGPLDPVPGRLVLSIGDTLILTRSPEPGRPAEVDSQGHITAPARIGVTLPEFFDSVRPNEPIWFDDGLIGGVITEVAADHVRVRITQARAGGEKLGAEKGINVPKTRLRVSPLTADDLAALPFIARHADIAGYSFVRTAADVRELRQRLAALGRQDLSIVLKIETQQAFENLPQLLMEAMHGGPVGVMIARGDLAIECGFERMAEIQEEILWISEAAHVPVVWATQVLETMAKTGRPSRSEITDAAMGERAECVMLNKGPYIVEAVQALDDILRRMEAHQEKKTARLRKLSVAEGFLADRALGAAADGGERQSTAMPQERRPANGAA